MTKIDSRQFRRALGNFPSGVAIITTMSNTGAPVGVTVSSFSSVSIAPPLILWSLQRTSPSLGDFEKAPYFNRFASQIPDKFSGVRTRPGLGGVPVIEGIAASFECAQWQQYDGGDHVIFVGEVQKFQSWNRKPLVFAAGKYDSLKHHAGPDPVDELWPIAVG